MNIEIKPEILENIFMYAELCDLEISGFMHADMRTGVINELFPLFAQECTGGETEIDEETILELGNSKHSRRINGWWHSHVNMGTFWSKTDEDCIEQLGVGIDVLVSIVVNKKREYKARVDLFRPYRLRVSDVVLVPLFSLKESRIEQLKAEIKEMVTKPKPIIHSAKEFDIIEGIDSFPFGSSDRATAQESLFPAVIPRSQTERDVFKHLEDQGWVCVDGKWTRTAKKSDAQTSIIKPPF